MRMRVRRGVFDVRTILKEEGMVCVDELEAFAEDGGVRLYEVEGVLLGRIGVIRFMGEWGIVGQNKK
ncbi:hypothetical protein CCP3SC1AL1_510016 [Gammaproteobacteria bacterium]